MNTKTTALDAYLARTAAIHAKLERLPNADARHVTYRELYCEVNVFANVLRLMGVKREIGRAHV